MVLQAAETELMLAFSEFACIRADVLYLADRANDVVKVNE